MEVFYVLYKKIIHSFYFYFTYFCCSIQSTFAVLRHTADRSKLNSKQGMSDMHHSNLMQSIEQITNYIIDNKKDKHGTVQGQPI